jgi:recombination protein RecA
MRNVTPWSVDAIIEELTKTFGLGTVVRASQLKQRPYRTTGSIVMDMALGGGYGYATIVDVIGKQSAGKTLLFEMAAATAQRVENKPSCLFDFEGTHDPKRFAALGGDPDGLVLVRAENFGVDVGPMFLEWVTDMLKVQLSKNMFALIGMDSTAAMVSKAEYEIKAEKGEEQATMAYTARGMASQLKQIVGSGLLGRSDTTVMYMSQMRDNIGGRGFRGAPPADKRTGGRALPFFAATQLEVKRGDVFTADLEHSETRTEKGVEVGHETKVIVRKNKLNAVQGRACGFELYSEGEVTGLDHTAELVTLAVLTGRVGRAGKWYTLPLDERKFNGKDALLDFLRGNAAVSAALEVEVRRELNVIQERDAPHLEPIMGDPEEGEEQFDTPTVSAAT